MRGLLVILILGLLGFGSNKLRTMGSELGSTVKRFRRFLRAVEGSSATRSEQVESTRPDAEFPEVADAERVRRKGD
jgi:Sec-independent protein translocase protein TatA